MLLYSRKKVRYRRDGYCWKKRKDGKTTREDHMKLKVQGMEVSEKDALDAGAGEIFIYSSTWPNIGSVELMVNLFICLQFTYDFYF